MLLFKNQRIGENVQEAALAFPQSSESLELTSQLCFCQLPFLKALSKAEFPLLTVTQTMKYILQQEAISYLACIYRSYAIGVIHHFHNSLAIVNPIHASQM